MSKATAQIEGRVIHRGDRIAAGTKHKTIFIVECSSKPEYPNEVQIEAYGNDISETAATLRAGDMVTVDCYVAGREYKGKWYTNIKASKITVVSKASKQQREESEPSESGEIPF